MSGDKIADALAAEAARRKGEREQKAKAARRKRQTKVSRTYHGPDQLRIAYFAGQGMSGGEIATAIGGTTRFRIAALLSKVGLSTVRRKPSERVVRINVDRTIFERLVEASVARDLDPLFAAGKILEAVASEPVLMANLLQDVGP